MSFLKMLATWIVSRGSSRSIPLAIDPILDNAQVDIGDIEPLFHQSVRAADIQRTSVSLLRLRMDNFSLVEDGFDGLEKAAVLNHIGRAMQQAAAGSGVISVSAEGNFFMVLHGGPEDSANAADRILFALQTPIQLGIHEIVVSCSIGIAVYPDDGPSDKTLGHASLALRRASECGGQQYQFYTKEIADQARDEALMVNDLSQAVRRGELSLCFQPKIDSGSMQVTSAEALLRWHHPERGVVSPVVFIPLAEKYRLMDAIGAWVFEEACRKAAKWLKVGLSMRVAVNISGYQMRQHDLVDQILATLQRYRLDPNRFTCEITETAAMADTLATKRTFEKMRLAGLHVSIDDFGTGYSSLAALRRIPAAELKIDMAFVKELEQSKEARSIARSIIEMAKALNLKVVAEGVETEGQTDILVEMGCHQLQGFFFSVPINADEIERMANSRLAGENEFRSSLFIANGEATAWTDQMSRASPSL